MKSAAETPQVADVGRIDPDLRALLDHIGADLAEEYIRLMEAAANAETTADDSATNR